MEQNKEKITGKKKATGKKLVTIFALCCAFMTLLAWSSEDVFAQGAEAAPSGSTSTQLEGNSQSPQPGTKSSSTQSPITIQSLLQGNSQSVQIILLLTAITLVPILLIMLTGFTRIVIVLSIARNAIGLSNMPPNSVIIGLSLFITYFVMSPVLGEINQTAYQPYVQGQIEFQEFTDKAMDPLREFMFKQTYQSDLNFFCNLSGTTAPSEADKDTGTAKALASIPDRVVIASFVTSELKHAFAIGFFIYIPFVVIDMIVASTLMSMGMMMLPPAMISMPFKILLFVLVDGWQLTIGTLISSFGR